MDVQVSWYGWGGIVGCMLLAAAVAWVLRASKRRAKIQWIVVHRLMIGDRWHSWKELVAPEGDVATQDLHQALDRMVREALVERQGEGAGHPIYQLTGDGWRLVKEMRWNG